MSAPHHLALSLITESDLFSLEALLFLYPIVLFSALLKFSIPGCDAHKKSLRATGSDVEGHRIYFFVNDSLLDAQTD